MSVDREVADRTGHLIDTSVPVAVGMPTVYVADAARSFAAAVGRPVMLLASRRQVERSADGGGYTGLSTEQWATRLADARRDGHLLLCRDHAGPYQHPSDGGHDLDGAVRLASLSLEQDIESGVDVLHIDSSLAGSAEHATLDDAVAVAVHLVGECTSVARRLRRPVHFEVGWEVQAESVGDPDAFGAQLEAFRRGLSAAGAPGPMFVVAQLGTLVTGTDNVGVMQSGPSPAEVDALLRIAAHAGRAGTRLKVHNADYLGPDALRTLAGARPWVNVSPELGVTQVGALLRLARRHRVVDALDDFCQAALAMGQWRRWLGDRRARTASDDEKVLLGGCYAVATDEGRELISRIDAAAGGEGSATRAACVAAVRKVMERFHRHLA